MKYILLTITLLLAFQAFAQDFPPQMEDAAYLATLKAVLDYKMNDEETLQDIQKLRENEKFNESLQKKLQKLNNKRTKNSKNKRVYKTLINSGKKVYNELN